MGKYYNNIYTVQWFPIWGKIFLSDSSSSFSLPCRNPLRATGITLYKDKGLSACIFFSQNFWDFFSFSISDGSLISLMME